MGTLWRESRMVVKRARIWVIAVANTMCHVVKNKAIVRSIIGSLGRHDSVAELLTEV
jgi:hypothetical protein